MMGVERLNEYRKIIIEKLIPDGWNILDDTVSVIPSYVVFVGMLVRSGIFKLVKDQDIKLYAALYWLLVSSWVSLSYIYWIISGAGIVTVIIYFFVSICVILIAPIGFNYVLHDSFALFIGIFKIIKNFYRWPHRIVIYSFTKTAKFFRGLFIKIRILYKTHITDPLRFAYIRIMLFIDKNVESIDLKIDSLHDEDDSLYQSKNNKNEKNETSNNYPEDEETIVIKAEDYAQVKKFKKRFYK